MICISRLLDKISVLGSFPDFAVIDPLVLLSESLRYHSGIAKHRVQSISGDAVRSNGSLYRFRIYPGRSTLPRYSSATDIEQWLRTLQDNGNHLVRRTETAAARVDTYRTNNGKGKNGKVRRAPGVLRIGSDWLKLAFFLFELGLFRRSMGIDW